MLRYKVITLDIHNTLMRVNQSTGHQYCRAARQHGIKLDPNTVDKAFASALREQRAKHPNYGINSGMSSNNWWNEVVRRTFMSSGYTDDKAVSQIANTLYEDFKLPKAWSVFPEVKSTLTSLNRLGACLGVVSNCDERVVEALRSLDLASHFAFVLLSVFTKHEKPESAMFNLVLERLRVEPGECLHVGDNVQKDYWGARSVGMSAVIVDRDGSLSTSNADIAAEHFIPDLAELENLLRPH